MQTVLGESLLEQSPEVVRSEALVHGRVLVPRERFEEQVDRLRRLAEELKPLLVVGSELSVMVGEEDRQENEEYRSNG